jgi:hypothetical protein
MCAKGKIIKEISKRDGMRKVWGERRKKRKP